MASLGLFEVFLGLSWVLLVVALECLRQLLELSCSSRWTPLGSLGVPSGSLGPFLDPLGPRRVMQILSRPALGYSFGWILRSRPVFHSIMKSVVSGVVFLGAALAF